MHMMNHVLLHATRQPVTWKAVLGVGVSKQVATAHVLLN